MGYSWSSAVAQDVTLGILQTTGFPLEQVICDSEPPPENCDEVATVCTDDTIMFHTDPMLGKSRLDAFDDALQFHGVPRRKDKDITLADELTALGCLVTTGPPSVDPDPAKLWPLLL